MLQLLCYNTETKPEPGGLVRLDRQPVLWEASDAPTLGLGLGLHARGRSVDLDEVVIKLRS